MIETDE